jgi:hypothetical protein
MKKTSYEKRYEKIAVAATKKREKINNIYNKKIDQLKRKRDILLLKSYNKTLEQREKLKRK